MQKFPLLVAVAIIAITAMFVVGITPTHFVKAGSCSSSFSSKVINQGLHFTLPGGCSFSVAGTQSTFSTNAASGKSSCSSSSAASSGQADSHQEQGNGAVSCSAHSP